MRIKLSILAVLFLLFSCSQNESFENSSSSESTVTGDAASKANVSTQDNVDNQRKVIWNASLNFQVANVDESTKKINSIAKKFGAFIADMDLSSNNYRISNTIKLRVKSSQFDSLINSIKGESIYMKNIKISSQDVTEEYIDIESRLKTKKEVRERYINILRNKTGEIKDVIAAEEAIRKITEEIEAKEGRLRYLNDQVNFSTITVMIYEEVEFIKEPDVYIKPYSQKLLESLEDGWSIITNLILGLATIWPIILITVLIIWKKNKIRSLFRRK